MGDPPSLPGAVNATVACALPALARPMTGAPGVAAMVIENGCVPVPPLLVAATMPVKVPDAVGVPESTPAEVRPSPVGSVPVAFAKVGVGEPEAVKVCV